VTSHHTLSVQFEEKLVVYQSPARIGALAMRWDPKLNNDSLPKNVALDYLTYTLDNAKAFHKRIDLHIEWKPGEE